MPITKHNFIVKDVKDLARVHPAVPSSIAKSGRPGPVLVDITKDVTANTTEYIQQVPDRDPSGYCSDHRQKICSTAAELIKEAKRPYDLCGRRCDR